MGFSWKAIKTAAKQLPKSKKTWAATGAAATVGGATQIATQDNTEQPVQNVPETIQISDPVDIGIVPSEKLLAASEASATSTTVTSSGIEPPKKPQFKFSDAKQQSLYDKYGVINVNGTYTNQPEALIANAANPAEVAAQQKAYEENPMRMYIDARRKVADTMANIVERQKQLRDETLYSNPAYVETLKIRDNLVSMVKAGNAMAARALFEIVMPRISALESGAESLAASRVREDPTVQRAALEAKAEFDIANKMLTISQKTVSQTIRNSANNVKELAQNPIVVNTAFATGMSIQSAAMALTSPKAFENPVVRAVSDATLHGTPVPPDPTPYILEEPKISANLSKLFANALVYKYGMDDKTAVEVGTMYKTVLDTVYTKAQEDPRYKQIISEIEKQQQVLENANQVPSSTQVKTWELQKQSALMDAISRVYKTLAPQFGVSTLANIALKNAPENFKQSLEAIAAGEYTKVDDATLPDVLDYLRTLHRKYPALRDAFGITQRHIDDIQARALMLSVANTQLPEAK